MNKLSVILLIIVLLIGNFYIVNASNSEGEDFSFILKLPNKFNETPSYSTFTRIRKSNINRGDIIEVEVFIVGKGDVTSAELVVVFPPDIMPVQGDDYRNGNVTYIVLPPGYDIGKQNKIVFLKDFELKDRPLGPVGTIVKLPNYIFQHINIHGTRILPIEKNNTHAPPFLYSIKTHKESSTGDKELKFILTYSDGNRWYQDKQIVNIHINNWKEENEIEFVIWTAVIVSILLTIGKLVLMTIDENIKKYLPNNQRVLIAIIVLFNTILWILYRMEYIKTSLIRLISVSGIWVVVILILFYLESSD